MVNFEDATTGADWLFAELAVSDGGILRVSDGDFVPAAPTPPEQSKTEQTVIADTVLTNTEVMRFPEIQASSK